MFFALMPPEISIFTFLRIPILAICLIVLAACFGVKLSSMTMSTPAEIAANASFMFFASHSTFIEEPIFFLASLTHFSAGPARAM